MTATIGHLTGAELSINGGATWINLSSVLTGLTPGHEVAEIEAPNFQASTQKFIPKLPGAGTHSLELTINGGQSEAYSAFKKLAGTNSLAQLRVYPTPDLTTGFTQFTGRIGSISKPREDQSIVIVTISFIIQAIPAVVGAGL